MQITKERFFVLKELKKNDDTASRCRKENRKEYVTLSFLKYW